MKMPFCAACGKTEELENHHLIPKVLDGLDEETNIITLCSNCHGKLHKIKNRPSLSNLQYEKKYGVTQKELLHKIFSILETPGSLVSKKEIANIIGIEKGSVGHLLRGRICLISAFKKTPKEFKELPNSKYKNKAERDLKFFLDTYEVTVENILKFCKTLSLSRLSGFLSLLGRYTYKRDKRKISLHPKIKEFRKTLQNQ